MKYLKPEVNCHTATTLDAGFQLAEFAGRLCYKSEGKASPGSAREFLKMLIKKGHTSILEHCPLYFEGWYDEFSHIIKDLKDSEFSRTECEELENGRFHYRIYSNLRVLYNTEKGHDVVEDLLNINESDLTHFLNNLGVKWFVPKALDTNTRYSCYIITQRSIVDELVCERIQSKAVESTRWVDYSSDDKTQGMGCQWCLPHWVKEDAFNKVFIAFKKLLDIRDNDEKAHHKAEGYEDDDLPKETKCGRLHTMEDVCEELRIDFYENIDERRAIHYLQSTILDERLYLEAKEELELPAQDAREYLFIGVKSEIYYTGYYHDYMNIIDKRLYDKFGKAHPNMHIIAQGCLDHINAIRENGQERASCNTGETDTEAESSSE